MTVKFIPMTEADAAHLRTGGLDAYGHKPERQVSDGSGVPCRRCLGLIEKDRAYLVLAWRPFVSLQPYAETGPVFIHADHCEPAEVPATPAMLDSPDYIVRGYGTDERIVYGTGGIIATTDIPARAATLLSDPKVAFVHVRSARNNCFQCRIERR
jgi:hypothetical protein